MANATYFASHAIDEYEKASIALDMTEMVNSDMSPSKFIVSYIDKFKDEVTARIARFS